MVSAGVVAWAGYDGNDGTFTDPNHSVRNFAFSTTLDGDALLIRDEQWAYMQYGEADGSDAELYSMKDDPQQYQNLASDPAYSDIVPVYRAKLHEKLAAVRDNDL